MNGSSVSNSKIIIFGSGDVTGEIGITSPRMTPVKSVEKKGHSGYYVSVGFALPTTVPHKTNLNHLIRR